MMIQELRKLLQRTVAMEAFFQFVYLILKSCSRLKYDKRKFRTAVKWVDPSIQEQGRLANVIISQPVKKYATRKIFIKKNNKRKKQGSGKLILSFISPLIRAEGQFSSATSEKIKKRELSLSLKYFIEEIIRLLHYFVFV